MNTIRPWSIEHIAIAACLIAAGAAFGVLAARSKAKTQNVLLISGILLMISEVFKEVCLYHLLGSYSWSDFPFQLCSIPMYFCVSYYFFPRRWMEQFVMVYSLIGAAASFMVPQAVFTAFPAITAHSLFWHTMLLFLGVFLAARQTKEDMKIRNFIPVGLTYVILAAAAVALNSIFYGVSEGRMNMFFLGPGWPDMFILNDIYTDSGWIAATLGMIGVSCGAGLGVYLILSRITVCHSKSRRGR